MKKSALLMLLAALMLCGPQCLADNPFVSTTKGMVLKTANKDKKGNIVSYAVTTVANVKQTPEGTRVLLRDEEFDADGKPITAEALPQPEGTEALDEKTTATMTEQLDKLNNIETLVTADKVIIPMTEMQEIIEELKASSTDGKTPGLEFDVRMDEASYPVLPKAGQKLAPVVVSFSMTIEGRTIEVMHMTVTDRQIIGQETVTVPAGTFDCWKVSETFTTKMFMMGKETAVTESWYADGIGEVKTINYTKRGKIESYSELVSVTNPLTRHRLQQNGPYRWRYGPFSYHLRPRNRTRLRIIRRLRLFNGKKI